MNKYVDTRRSSTPPPPYNIDPFQPNDEQNRETPLNALNLTLTPQSPQDASTNNRQPPPRDYLTWSIINSFCSLCAGSLCMFL
jgi:hypothetical protein